MFYYLNGTITILDTNLAVVDCGGVGYACHTTNYTISRLQVGRQARLYTYCNIKEDAFDIFGFYTREELDCFEKLLSVGGVGPKAALAILSVVTPDQFTLAVMTQDVKTLTMAQGGGKKLAANSRSGSLAKYSHALGMHCKLTYYFNELTAFSSSRFFRTARCSVLLTKRA